MTGAEYTRMTLAQMQSRRWRTACEMRNGNMVVPAGTEVKIVGKRGGLDISGAACPHCGVSVFVRRVRPWNVEEVGGSAPSTPASPEAP